MHGRTPVRLLTGFTLAEMLVVIAIIGILVALLLPAVQAAREAARRTSCSNNVKQIGLAMQNFHGTFNHLPPGAITAGGPARAKQKLAVPSGVDHGWVVWLLPYLEQQALHDQYRRDLDWRHTANATARRIPIKTLQCPSAPHGNRIDSFSASGFGTVSGACADYGVDNHINPGLFFLNLIDIDSKHAPEGVMLVDELQAFADVTDGLSHTMWVCEDAGRPNVYRTGKKFISGRVSGGMWADRDGEFITHGFDPAGTASPGPCAINCTNDNEIYSFHSGGAMCMFGDGSVKFVSQNVSIRVVGRVLTRSGGENIANF